MKANAYLPLLVLTSNATAATSNLEDDSESLTALVDRYIVTIHPAANLNDHVNMVQEAQASHTDHEGLTHLYDFLGFKGYAGHLSDELIDQLRNHSEIVSIEPDQLFEAASLIEEKRVGYGLDEISHRHPSPASALTYVYDNSAGSDTYGYIVDAGINCNHRDFRGRCTLGYNAVKKTPFEDPGGHGTHVAGIVGGTVYGTTKKSNLIAVKVMHKTQTIGAVILDGYQWAVKDIILKKRQSKAVINISVAGPNLKVLDDNVNRAYSSGVSTVCAAGNQGKAASTSSPGSARNCITVGATNRARQRAATSNFGPEVDIFAPGVDIKSDFAGNDYATTVLSGTSQAAGFVAGLVLYHKRMHSLPTAGATKQYILSLVTKGVVEDTKGSANQFAYNGSGK